MFELPDLSTPVYVAEALCYLPPTLVPDVAPRRAAARETLTELMVADIGDAFSSNPYLMVRVSLVLAIPVLIVQVRTAGDDIVVYQPFHYPQTHPGQSFTKNLRWLKIPNHHNTRSLDESTIEDSATLRVPPMRAMNDLGGYKTIFIPGGNPGLVLKESSSTPKVFSVSGSPVRAICSMNTSHHLNGMIAVDHEVFPLPFHASMQLSKSL